MTRPAWDELWETLAPAHAASPGLALRVQLIRRSLAHRASDGPMRVVDFGCGPGELLRQLELLFPDAELAGVDASGRALERARQRTSRSRLFQVDLEGERALPASLRGWATHLVCSEVLEHLERPAQALRLAATACAPAAAVVVTVPAGPRSAFDEALGHRAHFTRDTLRALLVEAQLSVEEVQGVGFPLFNLYRLAVIARGRSLLSDLASARPPAPTRLGLRVFRELLVLNDGPGRHGWQLLAVARSAG